MLLHRKAAMTSSRCPSATSEEGKCGPALMTEGIQIEREDISAVHGKTDRFGNHPAKKNKPDSKTNMQWWRDASEPSGKRMGADRK